MTLEYEACEAYHQPGYIKQLVMIGIPEAMMRIAMLERNEADIIHAVPGERIAKVTNLRFMNAIGSRVLAEKWQDGLPGDHDGVSVSLGRYPVEKLAGGARHAPHPR